MCIADCRMWFCIHKIRIFNTNHWCIHQWYELTTQWMNTQHIYIYHKMTKCFVCLFIFFLRNLSEMTSQDSFILGELNNCYFVWCYFCHLQFKHKFEANSQIINCLNFGAFVAAHNWILQKRKILRWFCNFAIYICKEHINQLFWKLLTDKKV